MRLAVSPSTGKTHRFNAVYQRTRCGVNVSARGWRVIEGDAPTCAFCAAPREAK